MKRVFTALVIALAAVACVYLSRFEFAFSRPPENGEYHFRLKFSR